MTGVVPGWGRTMTIPESGHLGGGPRRFRLSLDLDEAPAGTRGAYGWVETEEVGSDALYFDLRGATDEAVRAAFSAARDAARAALALHLSRLDPSACRTLRCAP